MGMDEKATTSDVFTLRFYRDNGNLEVLPASILAKVVEATQQVVFLLAHQEEGIALPAAGSFKRELEQNYTLLCSPLKPGSVIVPMDFAPSTNVLQIQSDVINLFSAVGSAITKNDERELVKTIPDARLRRRVLDNISAMVPPPHTGIRARLSGPHALNLTLSESTRRYAAELRRKSAANAQPAVNRMVITGQLMRIDFAARKLTLQYPVNGRELECLYSDDAEEDIVAKRRDWIQVTGNVVLDSNGIPERVTDADLVRPLDLSPIELTSFDDEDSGTSLRFRLPISIQPTQDETKQLLLLDFDPLKIHIHAMTRDELEDVLYGLIWVLWDDYVKGEESNFLPEARSFKRVLLEYMEEVELAA